MIPANSEGNQVDERINAKGGLLKRILLGGSKKNIIGLLGGKRQNKSSLTRSSTNQQMVAVPYSNRVDHESIATGSAMAQNSATYPQVVQYDPQPSSGMQPSKLPSVSGQNITQYQQPTNTYQQPNHSGQPQHQVHATVNGQSGYPLQNSYMQQNIPYASGQNIVQYQQPIPNAQPPTYPVQSYPQGHVSPYVQSGFQPMGMTHANGVQIPAEPKRKKQIGKKIFKGLSAALEIAGDLGVVPGLGLASKVVNKISQ